MKLVEWDSIKAMGTGEPQKEIPGQIVAVVVSDFSRYYIRIEDDAIHIHKTGFMSDQISVSPISSNVILIK